MRKYLAKSQDLNFVKKLTRAFSFKLVVVPYKSKTRLGILQKLKWICSFPNHKILFHDFEDLSIMGKYTNLYNTDSCIVYSMPYLLSANYLDLLKGIKLNIHLSRLPQFRGPNPVIHQILSNEDIYVTIHEIDQGEDSGDILVSSKITISNFESYNNLDDLIINKAIEMLKSLMSVMETATRIKQDLTIKRKRAKRLNEEQLINMLKTKSFDHYVILKLLLYRPHLIKGLIKKTKFSYYFNYKVDPQSTSPRYFVIPSGAIHYRRFISLYSLLKSLKNTLSIQ